MMRRAKPIRRFWKPYLESHDFKVLEAGTGEGLAMASSHKPDIILLDWDCRPDGLLVLKRIRNGVDPLSFLTPGQGKRKGRGLDAGADDYLAKLSILRTDGQVRLPCAMYSGSNRVEKKRIRDA